MSEFSELIKNFEKTRDYVRDFFIYGFKVRNDFTGKSSRTYDDQKRRIESWLDGYMKYENAKHGKQISINLDSGHIYSNPLYRAYYSKSFTDNDIKLHFFIMDILAEGGKFSVNEIVSSIDKRYGELFEIQTVRNKLKEYIDEGILIRENNGKVMYVRLSEDTLESFMNYNGIEDALSFFSCTSEFGEIGDSILKSCGKENNIFLIKHNYISHTLEDIILLPILDAINSKHYISFRTASTKKNNTNNIPKVIEKAVPMQIVSSVQTGRRFLIAYYENTMRFFSFRLDQIKQVNIGGYCEEYDEIAERYNRNKEKAFGISFGNLKDMRVSPLKIVFEIDEKNEYYVAERIIREKRNGIFEKKGENIFVLTLDISDPNEAMHWLKTFIGRIKSIEGGTSFVRKRFEEDIEKMYCMYGGQNDNIQ